MSSLHNKFNISLSLYMYLFLISYLLKSSKVALFLFSIVPKFSIWCSEIYLSLHDFLYDLDKAQKLKSLSWS